MVFGLVGFPELLGLLIGGVKNQWGSDINIVSVKARIGLLPRKFIKTMNKSLFRKTGFADENIGNAGIFD